MNVKFLKIEPIKFENPMIVSIVSFLKAQTEYEPEVFYDILSKMRAVEEANAIT
jgi:hypothetical protein